MILIRIDFEKDNLRIVVVNLFDKELKVSFYTLIENLSPVLGRNNQMISAIVNTMGLSEIFHAVTLPRQGENSIPRPDGRGIMLDH